MAEETKNQAPRGCRHVRCPRFTFAGMFAHVITFNAYQRLLALDALRSLGVKVEGFGCPTEYEASVARAR